MFKWIKDARKLPQVESQLYEAKAETERLKIAAIEAKSAHAAAGKALASANEKIGELEKKVRTQNEADLLLISAQISQRIIAGEKKETSPELRRLSYLQSAAMQNLGMSGAYARSHQQSFLGALGGIWPH